MNTWCPFLVQVTVKLFHSHSCRRVLAGLLSASDLQNMMLHHAATLFQDAVNRFLDADLNMQPENLPERLCYDHRWVRGIVESIGFEAAETMCFLHVYCSRVS